MLDDMNEHILAGIIPDDVKAIANVLGQILASFEPLS
jgi:hypothetical protein